MNKVIAVFKHFYFVTGQNGILKVSMEQQFSSKYDQKQKDMLSVEITTEFSAQNSYFYGDACRVAVTSRQRFEDKEFLS